MNSENLQNNLEDLLLCVVDTAIEIACADFGNIQLVDARTGKLQIVAQRGFPEYWVRYWNERADELGSCGSARKSGARSIAADVTKTFEGEALEMQLRAGVRACQSTPLMSRTGVLIGVFSTHYRKPWHPTGPVLRTLDSLARLAALAIEQARLR